MSIGRKGCRSLYKCISLGLSGMNSNFTRVFFVFSSETSLETEGGRETEGACLLQAAHGYFYVLSLVWVCGGEEGGEGKTLKEEWGCGR